MFRVPTNAESPSFDQTEKVGFWRWLFSSGTDRREWARRRDLAARLAMRNQHERIAARQAEAEAAFTTAKAEWKEERARRKPSKEAVR